MTHQRPQHKVDVFEMILHPMGDNAPVLAHAVPRPLAPMAEWQPPAEEGQLAVDVAETDKEIIVVSTMAGAALDKLEVCVHNDLLTIRGVRSSPLGRKDGLSYFHEECFWGVFSRSLVLPVDVRGEGARAEYKNGVLTVRIPKHKTEAKIPVRIVDD